ncbi:MAG TPA: histidine kinase [Steroidobacteraceae bacterium]|nr:histidine kinase [Steroidobacteraceae bacterium]
MPAEPNYPGSDRALFALWTLFWLLMMAVAIQDHYSDPGVRWWEPILWEGSSCLAATIWILLQRRVAHRWDDYLDQPLKWFGKHAVWLPVIAVTFITFIYAVRHGVYALTGETYEHASWPYTFLYESIKLVLFSALWLAIIFGLASFSLWKRERERLLELQKSLAESQLAQLKAQLQPHFLFNALNTISALMQSDVERADRLLTRLADLLRATLANSHQQTSLREEWKLLELYASIMQERFAGRVTLTWNASEQALDAAVPAMLLQPLLENAYKHGVDRSTEPVSIRVDAQRQGDELCILIHNTGSWNPAETSGIGVRNCRERLALVYGDRASLMVAPDADGVVASVTIPYEKFRA